MANLNELVKQLQGNAAPEPEVASSDSITDTTYVEKLASAVDFIVERIEHAPEQAPAAEKAPEKKPAPVAKTEKPAVTDLAAILKQRLEKKVLEKKTESTPDQDLTEQVLGKLLKFRVENKKQEAQKEEAKVETTTEAKNDAAPEETAPAATKEDPVTETPVVSEGGDLEDLFKSESNSETNEANETPDSGVEKAASADKPFDELTLSDMLEGALSADVSESGLEETVKTAGVRSDDGRKASQGPTSKEAVTAALRSRLLAAYGKEV